MSDQPPSLVRLEQCVTEGRMTDGLAAAVDILAQIDRNRGALNGIEMELARFEPGEDLHVNFATRFSHALGTILVTPGLAIPGEMVEALLIMRRWIDLMFRLGGLRSGRHFTARLPARDGAVLLSEPGVLILYLLLSGPEEIDPASLDGWAQVSLPAVVLMLQGGLAAPLCTGVRETALREIALDWLARRLPEVNLGNMTLGFISEPYMHTSYALSADKHRVKRQMIAQVRRAMEAAGATDMAAPPEPARRPRIVVTAEQFHSRHSIFRTHSRMVRALRERFEVIGVGFGAILDEPARECFDDFIAFPEGDLFAVARVVADRIKALRPHAVFHLGVGMAGQVITLATMRLAPVQLASYGHTATTMAPNVDYMVLPSDFVRNAACFSEQLMLLPPAALPYARPVADEGAPPPRRTEPRGDGWVRIAVPASIMKINATFLAALARIEAQAGVPVRFEFFALGAIGLLEHQLRREVLKVLPGAVVHGQSDRQTYLARLGECDFFMSPFPYGNMNSIVDAMVMGVPGVCLDGDEAHSHADAAFFRRFGLPGALIAEDEAGYVEAALRLVRDGGWRAECQAAAVRAADNADSVLYDGDETQFAQAMAELLARHGLMGN